MKLFIRLFSGLLLVAMPLAGLGQMAEGPVSDESDSRTASGEVPDRGLTEPITDLPWSEDFSGVDEFELPAGWSANEENWYVFNSSHAGGEEPELVFWWEPEMEGLARVQTPAFKTTDYDSLEVSFKHLVDNFEDPGVYDLRFVTMVDGDRHVVLEWEDPDDIPAEEITLDLSMEEHGVGAEELYLAWEFEGSSDNIIRWAIDDITVSGREVTNAENEVETPMAFMLNQNYPNPFNPETTIPYQLPESAHVTLTVYDIAGRRIATLVDEIQQPGQHSVRFDGTSMNSGIYLYRIQADDFEQTRKLMLIK